MKTKAVIPAKAGIQSQHLLDAGSESGMTNQQTLWTKSK
jgi:hypothetical protein